MNFASLLSKGIYYVVTFISGFFTGKLSEKKKHAEKKAADAREDLDIANQPSKHGSDLLDSLQRK